MSVKHPNAASRAFDRGELSVRFLRASWSTWVLLASSVILGSTFLISLYGGRNWDSELAGSGSGSVWGSLRQRWKDEIQIIKDSIWRLPCPCGRSGGRLEKRSGGSSYFPRKSAMVFLDGYGERAREAVTEVGNGGRGLASSSSDGGVIKALTREDGDVLGDGRREGGGEADEWRDATLDGKGMGGDGAHVDINSDLEKGGGVTASTEFPYESDGPFQVGKATQMAARMNDSAVDCSSPFVNLCHVSIDVYYPAMPNQSGAVAAASDDHVTRSGYGSGKDSNAAGEQVRDGYLLPATRGGFPLAVFSPGFTRGTDSYASYGNRLASWGYVALIWSPDIENAFLYLSHRSRGLIATLLIDWALDQSRQGGSPLFGLIENNFVGSAERTPQAAKVKASGEERTGQYLAGTPRVFMMGHADGGKTAMLAAEYDGRVVGVLGFDPVDCPPPYDVESQDYPSSIHHMDESKALTAWVGSEYGSSMRLYVIPPCAPSACGYDRFYEATERPLAWEVMIKRSGHMQFCDNELFGDFVCVRGEVDRKTVLDLSHTVMVSWAEATVRKVDIGPLYLSMWSELQANKSLIEYRVKLPAVQVA